MNYVISDTTLITWANALRTATGRTDTLTISEMTDIAKQFNLANIEVNFDVVGGTTQPSNPIENTIWVNTDIAIGEYAFGNKNPYVNEIIENCIIDEANQKMNSSGTLTSDIAWSITKYYPVTANAQYYLTFVENGACSAYYDKNYTFISSFNAIGNAWTSLPSIPSNAAYVRFCLRTYTDTNDINNFKYKYIEFNNNINIGNVWIKTGIASNIEFNLLKKNKILTYPTAAYQWDGNSFIQKNIFGYIDNSWKQPSIFMYKNGTLLVDNWIPKHASLYDGGNWGTATGVSIDNGDYIRFTTNTSAQLSCLAYFPNKVNLTNISRIRINGYIYKGTQGFWFCVWDGSAVPSVVQNYVAYVGGDTDSTKTIKDYYIDVSNLTGSYYLGAGGYNNGTTNYIDIHELELIP